MFIKSNVMRWVRYMACGGMERNLHNFFDEWVWRHEPTSKNRLGESVILKFVLTKYENLNRVWVFLFESRDKWPAVVIFVINFVVLQNKWNSFSFWWPVGFQNGLCSLGFVLWSFARSVFRPVVWFVRCLLTTYESPKPILRCPSIPLTCADGLIAKVENNCVLLFTAGWI